MEGCEQLTTIPADELQYVDGAWLNVGVAWGDNNRIAVGTGKPGLNLQFAWGNNNHVATGEGPTLRLNWGTGNTFENR